MMTEDAPGLGEVLSHFALDLPWIAAMAAASVLYVLAFCRAQERPTRSRHPMAKLIAFQAGIVALFIAVLSPLEHYGNQVLWVNFLDFLVLTMVAPPLLLLGSPLTLAFRASGPAWRARLRSFYRCRCMRYLSFPVVSGLVFAVVTYVWQFTGLLHWAAEHPFARDFQQVTLLLVSLLFWMPALAVDPMRWRLPYPLRGLYVLTEMVHKSFFAGMFLTASRPFHPTFAAHAPGWGPEAMTDQRYAIFILWFGGNIIFIGMLVYIIARWLAYEQRNQSRVDYRLSLARAAAERRQAALAAVFEKTV